MKPVFIGVLPNFENEEYLLARQLLFGAAAPASDILNQFESELIKVFYPQTDDDSAQRGKIFLVDSARSAFYTILKSLNLPAESEVILPAFTCVVVVNPVLWANLNPVYVDISAQNFNPSLEQILSAITPNTKVILAQHTFGFPLDVPGLRRKLDELGRDDILIVEDLAHSLGGKYLKNSLPDNPSNDVPLGTVGDFAILTFGVEKSISSIRGGAILINYNSRNKKSSQLIEENYSKLPELPQKLIQKLLVNPLLWSVATPLYNLGFGKYTLGKLLVALFHTLGLLGIEIDKIEYSGGKPNYLPAKLDSRLASLGLVSLHKLKKINLWRRQIAEIYFNKLQETKFADNIEQLELKDVFYGNGSHVFLRYPIVFESKAEKDKFISSARKIRIVVGDWYKTMFYTKPEYLEKLKYTPGCCPVAESISPRVVNLPTSLNVTSSNAQQLVSLLGN